jgi:membrane-associated phospholipid phosphatase
MAVSRLYLGVHYPSDIAAGAALGTVVGSLACR